MRIRRVQLQNYRGVIDSTVEFPRDGVTIIEGANERGKTSIPEAVDLILETLDSSRAKRIRDIKPVHRDEVPEVEIEVAAGVYRFVYRKRWLRRPETTLTITAPLHEQLTGREAHERVRGILDERLDQDLWRALRVEQRTGAQHQGAIVPSFNVRSLVDALDVAVGGDAMADGEDSLWRRICDEREKYWTATGRVKQERNELRQKVEDAREKVADLEGQLREIERDAARVDELRAEGARWSAIREECDREVGELETRHAEAERLRGKVELLDSAHREAKADRDRIVSEQRRRGDLVAARDSRRAEVAELEEKARQAAPVVEAAIEHNEKAQSALQEAQEALRAAEADHRVARGDHEHHRSLIDYEQLSERRQRATTAQKTLRDAESFLESVRIDDDLLARIEEAHLGVVRAEAALQNAGVRLEGNALSEITLRIDGAEATFSGGDRINLIVAQEMEFSVPGVVELQIRAGTESRNLVTELNRARDEFHNLCNSGGVADLVEARRAVANRDDAERNREQAIANIKSDLRDLTPELMQQKIEGIRQRVERYTAERPSHPPLPATYEEAKQISAEMKELVSERRSRYRMQSAEAESAARTRKEQDLRKATLEGRIENARNALAEDERRLTLAREERSDSQMEEDLSSAQRRVDEAFEALARSQKDLSAADPDSIKIRLENARAAGRRAVAQLADIREEENKLRAGLRLRGEEGLYTRFGEAERQMLLVKRQRERLEGRARAAELLHATFGERRQESRLRYHAPLTERIENFGRIVFGPSFKVELGDDLEVVRRTMDGATLDINQLSAGALEQLGLLSRLACAAIVSPDGGGAPVIIDDALGWSDPDRLSRMGAAIGVAGKECQIIILTCTPGRYAHVGNAKVIRMPASGH